MSILDQPFSTPNQPVGPKPLAPTPAPPLPQAPVIPQTRQFGDAVALRQSIFDRALESAKSIEPLRNELYTLQLADVGYAGPEQFRKADHKRAVLTRGTLARKLQGTWNLIDNKTGQAVAQRTTTLANVPYLTDSGTFVNKGVEYTLAHQMRLRAGVYAREKENGELEAHVNTMPGKGRSHRYQLDPQTGVFKINIGQASIPLMPLLKVLGVSDTQIKEAWGNELSAVNMRQGDAGTLDKLYQRLSYKPQPGLDATAKTKTIMEEFAKMEMDPEVTKRTLGKEYKNMTPEAILDITKKLIKLNRKEIDPDDRDSMAFQSVMGPEDLIAERFVKDKSALRQLLWKATARKNLDHVPTGVFNKAINAALIGSGLGSSLEEINPAEIFDHQQRITRLGEGGIGSMDAIPVESRSVQPSHFGFIDFLRTPECYDAETEVMTRNGWKKWSDVTPADEFACLLDTGELDFCRASKLHAAHYDGIMYGANTGKINYLVTPNHRMWTRPLYDGATYRFELAPAAHLKFRGVLSGGFDAYAGSDAAIFVLPQPEYSSNNRAVVDAVDIADWAELLGWYLGEGNCVYRPDTPQYHVKITQCEKHNPENCNQIRALLNKLPFKWGYHGKAFTLATKQVAAYFKQFNGSTGRWIPEEFLSASKEARFRLFDALMKSEGRKNKRGERTCFCTSSQQLARDFERLAFGLGYSSRTVFEKDNRPQSSTGGCWIVHVHKQNSHQILPRATGDGRCHYLTQHYSGMVYCATVPGGRLYVRRHGSCGFWCGNSGKVGVDMRFARGAVKGADGKIYTPVKDLKTGETVLKSPQEIADMPLVFPGEEKSDLPMVGAIVNGRMKYIPRSEAKFGLPAMDNSFSQLSNMLPMKSMVKGQRAVMGSRMITQALPLENAEAPLVQSAKNDNPEESYEDEMGGKLGAIRADAPAQVISVSNDEIVLRDQNGQKKTIDLYNDMPFNRKSVTGDTKIVVRRADGTFYRGSIANYAHDSTDEVLCVDPETKVSSWHKITGYLKHENDKRLFTVSFLSGRTVTVTEDHSLITLDDNGELCPVYPLDCVVNKTRCPLAFIGAREFLSPRRDEHELDLGRLVGLYLSEGHIPDAQPNLLIIAVAPEQRAQEIIDLILRLYPESNPYRNGGQVCVAVPVLSKWLRENFGHLSHNKQIPAFVFEKPKEFLHGLIQGYFAGDGNLWADGNGAIQLTAVTVSRQLRDDLVDVLSALGVFATLFDAPRNHKNENWRDGFGLRVISGHLKYLLRWFFYQDRHEKFYTLIADKYRASPFDGVPITGAGRKVFYAGFAATKRHEKVYTWGSRGYAPKYKLVEASGPYGAWGRSDVLWDVITDIQAAPNEKYVYDLSVEKAENFAVCNGLIVHNTFWSQKAAVKPGDVVQPGQLLATSNFTDKNGSAALGLNLRVAYVPFRGRNYEDAIVISETASKRLSSQHMYQHEAEWSDDVKKGKNAFVSLFPKEYDRKVLNNFDDAGAIKKGTVVNFGDPLVLVTKQREQVYGKVHGGRKANFVNESITWEHHSPGVVTDVEHTNKGVSVVVKSIAKMEVGDKLTGRYGDKGVIAEVVPDDQMPKDGQGRPFEVLVSPLGVISRVNPAQVVEAALGKVAEKTGKPFKIKDFDDAKDLIDFAKQQLRQNNLSDTEDIVDPETGRKIKGVLTGNRFFMKLHHTSESKVQGRAMGTYTAEGTPAKGGAEGAKRVGMLDLGALLSHGAGKVIRDAKMVRGQANPEYWAQFMAGYDPPLPKIPHVYEKFVSQLRASGINVVRTGTRSNIMAMTDKDIDSLAGDREIQNADTVDWKGNLKPKQGGLFDETLTGGHGGNRWSKITLHEPLPNPVMEEPIRRVLNLTQKQFRAVLAGDEKIGELTGPKAIQEALANINLPKAIEQAREDINSGRRTLRDAAVRRLGYLKSAEKTGVQPKDWMLTKVPVLPPLFRPVSTMGSKKLPLVADANYLYKELLDANKSLKDASGVLSKYSDERLNVYDALKGVTGLGEPTHPKNVERRVKGFLGQIFGSSPKFGTVQRKLLSTTVDLVGRAVITPNPDLDMDEVALPEDKAWEIYKPFVVRGLVRRGMPRLGAMDAVKNRTKQAFAELNTQMSSRPIVINRAPVLHRYGMMAFKPKLTKNKVMEVNPVITRGFNADFDGDAMQFHVPSTPDAAEEALQKMLPSRNLFSVSQFKAHYLPNLDFQTGLYLASARQDKKAKPRVFASKKDAIAAYRRGEIEVDTPVHIVENS